MIEDTPPPNANVVSLFDSTAVDYTSIDESQVAVRVSKCKDCEKFMVIGGIPRCLETGFDINLMTTANELSCPLEKW